MVTSLLSGPTFDPKKAEAVTASVTFDVHPSRLAYVDGGLHWLADPDDLELAAGGARNNPVSKVTLTLQGQPAMWQQGEIVATTAELA